MMYKFENHLPEGMLKKVKKLGEEPTIHPTTSVHQCSLGSWTDIGPRVSLMETEVGDYTYFAGDASASLCAI